MVEIPTVALGPVDEAVPVLGQGTWKMEQDDEQACIRTLRHGIDQGLTLIDTAEMYGSGQVESLVGRAIDGLRDEVFLVTKVLPSNASRQGTIEACQASLERLGTDHVDLYLLHWSSRYPIQETMAAFRELVEEGLTRYVGVSNLSLEAFDAAQKALGEDIPLVTDQVLYWLGARNAENELIGGLADRGRSVMAYSPFGQAGMPAQGTSKGQALAQVAKANDATPHQVALAWVIRHDNVLTIPKTSSVDHLDENASAVEVELASEDLERLDQAFEPSTSSRLQTL